MKIHSLMIPDPITITANASISEAIELMKINSIRHLPVVTQDRKLEGFLTLDDLKQGLIPSMLGDLTLQDLMIKDPITVNPDDDMMGILSSTSRVDVVIGDQSGSLKTALQIINDAGGDIINVGMTSRQTGKRIYYFRLAACQTAGIKKALEKQGYDVLAAMD